MKLVILWVKNCTSQIPSQEKTALHQSLLKGSTGAWRISCSFEATAEKEKGEKKKDTVISHRCKCCMRKLLSATQKDTVQIWDIRIEHMQITDWVLSPTALQSDQKDERKRPKSAPFRKQTKISWGKKKEGRKKKFCFSCCHYWS